MKSWKQTVVEGIKFVPVEYRLAESRQSIGMTQIVCFVEFLIGITNFDQMRKTFFAYMFVNQKRIVPLRKHRFALIGLKQKTNKFEDREVLWTNDSQEQTLNLIRIWEKFQSIHSMLHFILGADEIIMGTTEGLKY